MRKQTPRPDDWSERADEILRETIRAGGLMRTAAALLAKEGFTHTRAACCGRAFRKGYKPEVPRAVPPRRVTKRTFEPVRTPARSLASSYNLPTLAKPAPLPFRHSPEIRAKAARFIAWRKEHMKNV